MAVHITYDEGVLNQNMAITWKHISPLRIAILPFSPAFLSRLLSSTWTEFLGFFAPWWYFLDKELRSQDFPHLCVLCFLFFNSWSIIQNILRGIQFQNLHDKSKVSA